MDARRAVGVLEGSVSKVDPSVDDADDHILSRITGEVISGKRPDLVCLQLRHAVVQMSPMTPLLLDRYDLRITIEGDQPSHVRFTIGEVACDFRDLEARALQGRNTSNELYCDIQRLIWAD